MFNPHWSPAVICCYAGEPDTLPNATAETSPETPTVETPPPAESPPTPSVEDLRKRIQELEAVQAGAAEREATWTAREGELSKSLAERDGQLGEFRAKAERATIVEALTAAAVEADAITPKQLVALLDRYASVSEDGVTLMIDGASMTAKECVKRMKDDSSGEFWNLFKNPAARGIGGHSNSGMSPGSGGRVNLGSLTSAEYRRLRRENPSALGLTDRRPQGGAR